jgi:ribosomal protein S18 acetylase RimI-like enzyme
MTEVRCARREDVDAVAALHAARIAEGFLVTLGPAFLRRLYRRMLQSPHAFVVVADEGREDQRVVTGFVAVARDTGRFYRDFLLRDGVVAAASSAPALVRAPRRVLETLRYGTAKADDLPRAEVLAIAVRPTAARRGVGRELLRAAIAELHNSGIEAVQVVTATDNTAALRMYAAAGFVRHARTEVHAGVVQEVLVWR